MLTNSIRKFKFPKRDLPKLLNRFPNFFCLYSSIISLRGTPLRKPLFLILQILIKIKLSIFSSQDVQLQYKGLVWFEAKRMRSSCNYLCHKI